MNDRLHDLVKVSIPSLAMNEDELVKVLQGSVYPGAKVESIKLVVGYCRAQNLDPMLKPVHIVPMDIPTGKKDSDGWDITEKRDVVMPGIGLYRIQASRAGEQVGRREHAGTSEPEFGPDVTMKLGEAEFTFPSWCRVIVRRAAEDGRIDEYPAKERWLENYATKGRSKKEPNKVWAKRPYAQLAKCAEAQALRKAFPEVGSNPTAEEMEGKTLEEGVTIDGATGAMIPGPQPKSAAATPQPQPEKPPVESTARREPDAGEGANADAPMSEGQLRILRAQMARAALTDADLVAKFGDLALLKFGQFNAVQEWIREKGEKVAG